MRVRCLHAGRFGTDYEAMRRFIEFNVCLGRGLFDQANNRNPPPGSRVRTLRCSAESRKRREFLNTDFVDFEIATLDQNLCLKNDSDLTLT